MVKQRAFDDPVVKPVHILPEWSRPLLSDLLPPRDRLVFTANFKQYTSNYVHQRHCNAFKHPDRRRYERKFVSDFAGIPIQDQCDESRR